MSEELKPCPFCGDTAEAPWREFGGYRYIVRCSNEHDCGAISGLHETRDIAVAKWNRRSLAPVQDDPGSWVAQVFESRAAPAATVQEGKPVAWMCQMFADSSKTYFFATNPLLKDDAPWDVIIPLYAAPPASQGWVACSERLPEEKDTQDHGVLGWFPGMKHPGVAHYKEVRRWGLADDPIPDAMWMPIPAAPRKEGE